MAKGKKTGGRNWLPGQSGNPAGPIPLPQEIKDLRLFNRQECERVLSKYLFMPKDELVRESQRSDLPMFELQVISVITKGVTYGDANRFNCILDRMIGKVKTQLDISGGESPLQFFLNMEPEERLAIKQMYEKRQREDDQKRIEEQQ